MSASQFLTDTQLVLLSQASQHPEGKIVPQGHLRGGVFQRVLASLAGKGLVQPAPLCLDEQVGQADGEGAPACPVISPAGLAALGIMMDSEGDATTEASALANHPAQGLEPDFIPDLKADLAPQSSAGDDLPADRAPSDPAIPDLAEADPASHLPQPPRAASKQAQVLVLLAQPEGVMLDALMAATGWLPHTTRAVLSGLRKRGHAIQRLPAGEGGSRYRLAAPASPDLPAHAPATVA